MCLINETLSKFRHEMFALKNYIVRQKRAVLLVSQWICNRKAIEFLAFYTILWNATYINPFKTTVM